MAKIDLGALVPDPATLKAQYLSDIKAGLYSIGITNVNIAPGSNYDVEADAFVGLVTQIFSSIIPAAESYMPDAAISEDLDQLLKNYGLSRRAAGGSAGQIQLQSDYKTYVASGTELVSQTGVRYQVASAGYYNNGDLIPIKSVDAGAKTNQDSGTLIWTSPPTGSKSTAQISIALTGGIDDEDDDAARIRLLARTQNVPTAGNPQAMVELTESTDPSVMKGFVYPIANGPSTQHIAAIGFPALVSKSRKISDITMGQTIRPTVIGNSAIGPETTVTTVQDLPVDVAMSITIPLAKSANSVISGPGNGLGWLDGSPFPRVNLTTHFFCPVTAMSDNANFTIDAPVNQLPIAGITRISWINKSGNSWTVNTATITSFTGTGPYTVSINNPFVGITVGDWIFPGALNMQTYLDSELQAFGFLGPGEKADLLTNPQAARFPRQSDSYPSNIDSNLLRAVIDSSSEVQTAQFFYRSAQTPAVLNDTTANALLIPPKPLNINDGPFVFIPRNLGFYPSFPLT